MALESSEKAYNDFIENFNSNARQFDSKGTFIIETRDLGLPVFIKWHILGKVSFLLSRHPNQHTPYILEKLISAKEDLNSEDGSVPALTALASQSKDDENADMMRQMAIRLIESGADPTYKSRKTCISKYTVPDAIGMVAHTRCMPVLRVLLSYWWPHPTYVLDSWTGHIPSNFQLLFPLFSDFGWPHGENVCSDVEYFIDSVIMKLGEFETSRWIQFKTQMQIPSSLKQQCRTAIRNTLGRSCPDAHKFHDKIKSIKCIPQHAVDYLLYHR